jgi:hypothetical protein
MKDETLYQAFQALFFTCWQSKDAKKNYTEKLRALCELGEGVWPERFEMVRGNHAWPNWQQRYNDPEAILPQQICDDALLQRITIEMLMDCSFHARNDWYINIEGNRRVDDGLGAIKLTYYNRVSEETLYIGQFFGCGITSNAIIEVGRHIRFIEGASNPMTADTE